MRTLLIITITLFCTGCDKAVPPSSRSEIAVQGIYSAALSNNGSLAVIGSINHGGSLWDLSRKERLFNWNHSNDEFTGIVATAIAPDESFAATASQRTIVLWNLTTGEPVWFWTAPGDVLSMALTPNGDYALLGLTDHTAVLFDIKNGGIKRKFNHQGKVRSVALSDDATLVLTGSDDFTAKLWDLQSGGLLQTWRHENQLVTTALSANGRYAFTAGQADKAIIWNTATGELVKEMPIKKGSYIAGAAYTAARFSPDETQLLTGTNSQLVQLWNINSIEEIKRWRVTKKDAWKPTSATVMALAFTDRRGRYHAIASNGLSYVLE